MTEKPKKLRGFPGKPVVTGWRGVWWVVQQEDLSDAEVAGPSGRTKPAAIRAWNRLVDEAMGVRT